MNVKEIAKKLNKNELASGPEVAWNKELERVPLPPWQEVSTGRRFADFVDKDGNLVKCAV